VTFHDHYSAYAADYARARPEYPPELFAWLRTLCPGGDLAWDAGTGSGQAARGLAVEFSRVMATDPSAPQLSQARAHPRITYRVGDEGSSGLRAGTADLVTAAQAAHWFDMPRFGAEAVRVLGPGGVVTIWGYGLCRIAPEVDAVLDHFYVEVVGPHWPPERRHVDSGYRDLEFPFAEQPWPTLAMKRNWSLGQFLGYVGTWSAVHRYRERIGSDPVRPFAEALVPVWGAPDAPRTVTWPLFGRVGTVGG
jgi:SAM-dependent methyltransferase